MQNEEHDDVGKILAHNAIEDAFDGKQKNYNFVHGNGD
jgi:hypothetical protein